MHLTSTHCLPADAEALGELVSQALRPECGIVGGLALDAAGQIWHAGLILDRGEGMLLPFAGHPAKEQHRIARLRLPREVAAVAPYCMAVRTELLGALAAGGPDGVTAAALVWQQTLLADGKPSLWTPFARFLVTGEPLSALFGAGMGAEEQARWLGQATDPFYHPSLSRQTLYEVRIPTLAELAF